MNEIREVHLRFHMNRDDHRRAWDIFKEMDRKKYESYADFVANAVILLKGSDNQSETARQQIDRNRVVVEYAERIASVVEEILARTIPSFLAGCCASGTIAKADPHQAGRTEGEMDSTAPKMIPEEEIDWGFLGEN